MKEKIHPNYKETSVICACGEVIHTRSTKENIHVEICSKCHPFFTGKQKLVDSAGMVDKYMKRYGKKQAPKPKEIKEKEAAKDKTVHEKLDEIKPDIEKSQDEGKSV